MTILSYLFRRFVGFVAVMIGISIITFGLSHLVPADPAIAALDHRRRMTGKANTAGSDSTGAASAVPLRCSSTINCGSFAAERATLVEMGCEVEDACLDLPT